MKLIFIYIYTQIGVASKDDDPKADTGEQLPTGMFEVRRKV